MYSTKNTDENDVTLKIKEEQLDIAKKWIETGKVKVYKDTFIEEKKFTVSVMREELVIEKNSVTSDVSNQQTDPLEIIRIPLSEEQVEFKKSKVDLAEVSIYKQKIQDIKHVEEVLRREEAKVTSFGDIEGSGDIIRWKREEKLWRF